jgi:hypothetical protein
LQCDELAVDSIIKNFKKTLDAPVFSLPSTESRFVILRVYLRTRSQYTCTIVHTPYIYAYNIE